MAEAENAWGKIGDSLTSGFSTVFSEGLPKWVDAEIDQPYEVNQPTRQYEQAPNGQTQRAGEIDKSITDNPWVIGGLFAAGVVGLIAAVK